MPYTENAVRVGEVFGRLNSNKVFKLNLLNGREGDL